MILYVNACVRENSRTDTLAKKLLKKLGDYKEIKLNEENLSPLTKELLEKRSAYIEKCDYENEMFRYAKDFASADIIVIAAPYWDLSFPSILKLYIENIYVTGIVSKYGEDGRPQGLCNASKLYYVTTAGGPYNPDYSYGYISEMAKKFLGIKETHLLYAEGLDIVGNDPMNIISEAEKCIDKIL